jgi:hypothetical protein
MQKGVNWRDYPSRCARGRYFQRRAMARPFMVVELAQFPPLHEARTRPDMLIRRSVMVPPELPPLLQVAHRVAVIFRGCAPEPPTALRQATCLVIDSQVGQDTMTVKGVWHTLAGARMNEFGHEGPSSIARRVPKNRSLVS